MHVHPDRLTTWLPFETSRQVGVSQGDPLGNYFTSNGQRLGEVYGIMAGLYVLAGVLSVRWMPAPAPSIEVAPRQESVLR